MTVFASFASSFRFLNNPSITDVQTILNDFNSEVVTNGSPAWTSPSGFTNGTTSGTWKSPVDSAGRFYQIFLARTTATRMEFKVIDQNQLTVCDREIDISGTTSVNYYTGQYHAWIESLVATPEVAQSGILEPSPLPLTVYGTYVFGNAFRNTSGSNDGGADTTGKLFMIDNGGSSQINRMRDIGQNIGGQTPGLIDAAGNLLWHPMEISAANSAIQRWSGRPYQVVLGDSSVGAGTTKTIIIGNAGETGTFRGLGGLVNSVNCRIFLRQS